jgi:hypothetical protein
MSRLDSFIRRLKAQRAALTYAFSLIDGVPGPVVELGLGNGRSYDHLRENIRDRRIFVFERKVGAHPDCIPPDEDLILGEVIENLPRAVQLVGAPAALLHSDLGSGDKPATKKLYEQIAPGLRAALAKGGILVSDQPVETTGLQALTVPDMVPNRYFVYRAI